MNNFASLGDILQAALNGGDLEYHSGRRQTEKSADALAVFLKTLPDTINVFQLLSVITQFVGEEVANETLRNMMGIRRDNGLYVLRPLNNYVTLQKISAIKATREVTNSGLKEAKDFVEGTIPMKLSANDARRIDNIVGEFGFQLADG